MITGESFLGLKVIKSLKVQDTLLVVAQGSVLAFEGQTIVNAANEGCLGGGGVDGAITSAGGKALQVARRALPVLDAKQTRCFTGDAVCTIGGDLPHEWCIHAVGPNYRMKGIPQGDKLLSSAYTAVMREAKTKAMTSVGFSLLSAGVFRGEQTLSKVFQIAIETVAADVYPEMQYAFLCAYTDEEVAELEQAFEAFGKKPSQGSGDIGGYRRI